MAAKQIFGKQRPLKELENLRKKNEVLKLCDIRQFKLILENAK